MLAEFVWALMSLSREAGSGDFWSGRGWASQSMLGYQDSLLHVVAALKQGAGEPFMASHQNPRDCKPIEEEAFRCAFLCLFQCLIQSAVAAKCLLKHKGTNKHSYKGLVWILFSIAEIVFSPLGLFVLE